MLDVDCDIVAGDWDPGEDWEAIARRSVAAAIEGAGFGGLIGGASVAEVSVRLSNDEEVQRLNRDYRGKDKPTNVLSFPMHSPQDIARILNAPDMDVLIGDMALAAETVAAEAEAKAIPVHDHAMHLIVHGTLHLLGHDHADEASAEAMEALETRILAGFGVADPYSDSFPQGVDERR